MRLDRFDNVDFDRGASRAKEALWLVANMLLASWLPGSQWRRKLLRSFGARIGEGVVIKPGVRVKFPWRLSVGDRSWIGEDVWIDNLATVTIGQDTCLSQAVYLCTGSHDWSAPTFTLMTRPIWIGNGCWVGAKASLAPGTVMETGAVLGMESLGKGRLVGDTIHSGVPSRPIKPRYDASENIVKPVRVD